MTIFFKHLRYVLKPLLFFIGAYSMAIGIRSLCIPILNTDQVDICFKLTLGILFGGLIWFQVKSNCFAPILWRKSYTLLILGLIFLFGLNNYVQVTYAVSSYFQTHINAMFYTSLMAYIISSVVEEIIFRGYVQTVLQERLPLRTHPISWGNYIASFLFLSTHLAFFKVMAPWFALIALINVLLFSLIAGYLYDKTQNLLIPMTLHILLNLIHFGIQGL